MPSAFSKLMLEEEAKFAARVVAIVMSDEAFKSHRFIMVGHSMGGVVTYRALLEDIFP